MEREDCWLTFTEALDQYLEMRDRLNNINDDDVYKDRYEDDMRDAANHMNALTSFIPHTH